MNKGVEIKQVSIILWKINYMIISYDIITIWKYLNDDIDLPPNVTLQCKNLPW